MKVVTTCMFSERPAVCRPILLERAVINQRWGEGALADTKTGHPGSSLEGGEPALCFFVVG